MRDAEDVQAGDVVNLECGTADSRDLLEISENKPQEHALLTREGRLLFDGIMAEPPLREQILSRAGELFHRLGYGAVSMEAVIEASGATRAEFHRHFRSKPDLGKAWLEGLQKRMRVMHESFLEKPGEPEKRLRRYFYSMRSWLEANHFRSCQFANTAAARSDEDEELLLLIDAYKREQRQFFIDLVGTLVEADQAQRLGTAVFLLYSGGMTEAQNLKATWPIEDALACAERLCGIGPR